MWLSLLSISAHCACDSVAVEDIEVAMVTVVLEEKGFVGREYLRMWLSWCAGGFFVCIVAVVREGRVL